MNSNPRDVPKKQHPSVSFVGEFSNPGQMTEEVLEHCLRELRAESASLLVRRHDNGDLLLVRALGSRENRHCGEIVPLGAGVSGRVAAQRKPLLVVDLSKESDLVGRKEKYPVDTFMSCPVLGGASVLGVINVSGRKAGLPFSRRDLRKLQRISEKCTRVLSEAVPPGLGFTASKAHGHSTTNVESNLLEVGNYGASILRCLPQYVVIFDRQFTITYCSREQDLCGLLGLKENEKISGQNVLELPVDVERDNLKQQLEALLQSGDPFSLNNVKVNTSAAPCVVNMSFSPLCTSEGDSLGALLLLDDNTKNYEIQRRLAEAEKFSLIGSMASMITHEVNNPLDGVMRLINLSSTLAKEDDPVREYLGEAQKGLQRIASLVRSLLGFSRKSASLDGEFSRFNAIVDNAVSVIRNKYHDRDIAVHLSLTPNGPTVKTNDFYQILSNLLSNAFDAVTRGEGNVRVETALDGNRFRLTVEDDGCGIPTHAQPRIFDTFWSTKDYGKGTGLGLAIVKKIVERYDGTIKVESAENAGTKMHLTFPLAKLSL